MDRRDFVRLLSTIPGGYFVSGCSSDFLRGADGKLSPVKVGVITGVIAGVGAALLFQADGVTIFKVAIGAAMVAGAAVWIANRRSISAELAAASERHIIEQRASNSSLARSLSIVESQVAQDPRVAAVKMVAVPIDEETVILHSYKGKAITEKVKSAATGELKERPTSVKLNRPIQELVDSNQRIFLPGLFDGVIKATEEALFSEPEVTSPSPSQGASEPSVISALEPIGKVTRHAELTLTSPLQDVRI